MQSSNTGQGTPMRPTGNGGSGSTGSGGWTPASGVVLPPEVVASLQREAVLRHMDWRQLANERLTAYFLPVDDPRVREVLERSAQAQRLNAGELAARVLDPSWTGGGSSSSRSEAACRHWIRGNKVVSFVLLLALIGLGILAICGATSLVYAAFGHP